MEIKMTSPNTIIADMQAEIDALRKERNELISAIEGMLSGFNEQMIGLVHDERAVISKARIAIEKTIGRAQC